jgi:hypothetical protein
MKNLISDFSLTLVFAIAITTSMSCSNIPLLTHDACEYARKVCFYADQICALVQDTTIARSSLITLADSMEVQATALRNMVLR